MPSILFTQIKSVWWTEQMLSTGSHNIEDFSASFWDNDMAIKRASHLTLIAFFPFDVNHPLRPSFMTLHSDSFDTHPRLEDDTTFNLWNLDWPGILVLLSFKNFSATVLGWYCLPEKSSRPSGKLISMESSLTPSLSVSSESSIMSVSYSSGLFSSTNSVKWGF